MLDSKRVHEVLLDCLYKPEEMDGERPAAGQPEFVVAEGIMNNFGFHPHRLAKHETEIASWVDELEDSFIEGKGGGWSFLNLCMDRHGNHWAEHPTMGELVALELAVGRANYCLPREMWNIMPGGMPYIVFRRERKPEAKKDF
jgi:hypothetical protein